MKRPQIALALGLMAVSASAASNTIDRLKARYAADAGDVTTETPIWCPRAQLYSSIKDGAWNNDRRYTTAYNRQGKILTDVSEDLNWTSESTTARYTRDEYTYNEDGQRLTGLSKSGNSLDAMTETSKFEFTYDAVVPSFITSYTRFVLSDGAWVQDKSSYKYDVTRDAQGRVTEVLRSDWDVMGGYIPASKSVITYGDDNKPATITSYTYGENWETGEYEWSQGSTLGNIVWKDCNNQILNGGAIYQGANRILSASHISDGKETGTVKVVYGPGEKDYTTTDESIDPYWGDRNVVVTEWREINPYNSYSIKESTTTYTEGSEEPSVSGSFESITRDAYGNLIEGILTMTYYGMTNEVEHQTGVVEYDATYGYPLVYTESQKSFYGDEQEPFLRKEFSDYINMGGVNDITIDGSDTNAPVEYFNLQGVRVETPVSGLYIRRQGRHTAKVLIK